MKKNEAKKVLDFLCRRWSQRVIDAYKEQMDLHCMIDFSRRRWFLDGGNIYLDFKYTWTQRRKKNEYAWIHPQNVRLCARYDMCNEHEFWKQYRIIWIPFEEESRMKSNYDILDFLFNFRNNADVFVEGFFEHAHFIDSGESFEEVLVKADLEDV